MITLKELKTMKKEELKKLKAQIEFLLSEEKKNYESDAELLYENISLVINSILKTKTVYKFSVIKKQKSFNQLLEVTAYLNDYLETLIEITPSKLQKNKFYYLFSKLMSFHITSETDIPLSVPTLLNLYARFPALLDNAFPGYIQSNNILFLIEKGLI